MDSEETNTRAAKKANNAIVNLLTQRQLEDFVKTIFTTTYKQKKGKKRKKYVDHQVPYVIKYKDHFWANPWAFSTTKEGTGYPTMPFKLDVQQTAQHQPASSINNAKSTWVPRIPVHGAIWRWANGFSLIPDGLEVSHLTDQPYLLTPWTMVVEEGSVNRARSACRLKGWHKEPRGEGFVRCPHDVICMDSFEQPPEEKFTSKNAQPSGMPGSAYFNKQLPEGSKAGALVSSGAVPPLVNKDYDDDEDFEDKDRAWKKKKKTVYSI